MTRRSRPWRVLVSSAALFFVIACGVSNDGAAPTTAPAPDQPPVGLGAVVDWEDPSLVVELDGGWALHACEGDGALLCVERAGRAVGVVEALSYPIDSFEDLDREHDPRENLDLYAAGFFEAIGSDRAIGCGSDYVFRPFPVEDFVLGGTPGISFGFEGKLPNGTPSELNLQYATIVGEHVLSIVAIAYDGGGCPGRDDLSGFHSTTLDEFRPQLEAVLHESPLPVTLVGIPTDIGY
jgi:hypothetical protein